MVAVRAFWVRAFEAAWPYTPPGELTSRTHSTLCAGSRTPHVTRGGHAGRETRRHRRGTRVALKSEREGGVRSEGIRRRFLGHRSRGRCEARTHAACVQCTRSRDSQLHFELDQIHPMPRPAAASPLAGAPRRLASSVAVTAAAVALLAVPARAASTTPTHTASQTAAASGLPTSSPSYAPGIISTVAGTGIAAFSGDGGAATSTAMNLPSGITFDSEGNLFIADRGSHRVRRVATGTGIITTVAGNGLAASSGDGGAATSASINAPHDVCFDPDGNLLIAEYDGHRVRRVAAGTGIITTFAGMSGTGACLYGGDGGQATNAQLCAPTFVVSSSTGDIVIADHGNRRVRRVAIGTGIISTVAGNGVLGYSGDGGAATSASMSRPGGIILDQAGNLFIADHQNYRVRKVAVGTGIISTVAGDGVARFSGDGGAAMNASLNLPQGLAFDQRGNLLVADRDNCRVRRVATDTGIISTVAGNGSCRFSGDGGAASSAGLNFPSGIVLDPTGNLFMTDSSNHRVRRVSAPTQPSNTPSVTPTCIITPSFSSSKISSNSASATPTPGTVQTIWLDSSWSRPHHAIFDSDGALYVALHQGRSAIIKMVGGMETVLVTGTQGPTGFALAPSGDLLVADYGNNRVLQVDRQSGAAITIATTQGNLWGIAVTPTGDLLMTDRTYHVIMKQSLTGTSGAVRIAGAVGSPGTAGEGGPASAAQLNTPFGIKSDQHGNVYFADFGNGRICRIDSHTGILTVIARDLAAPAGVAVDCSGDVFSRHLRSRLA